jgi:thiol:disulfide interchange protein DsbA
VISGWLILLWFPFFAFAGNDPYQEGVHYQRLATPVPTSTGDKIEVVEVFWYGCGHCYRLEPVIEAWLAGKPGNVEFIRIPAVLGRNWEPHARTFYAAQVLGVEEKIHKPLMDAMHVHGRSLADEEQLAGFFAEQGVAKESFLQAYRSFEVETRLRRSQQLVQRYGIDGVPAVIVNGKYLTNGTMTGATDKIFEVVDYLIAKESKTS